MLSRVEGNLEKLAMLPGLAGFEEKVAAFMKSIFEDAGLTPFIDTFGNVIAKVEGTNTKAPVIMISAHMDSLGFLVRYVEEDGFLRIERLGGIPEKVLPATQIQVQCRDGSMIDGVIGVKAHHVTPPEEKYIVDKYMNLFVDIGASSRQEVFELGIDVGSPIVYKPKFQRLLGHRALMSAVDDRGGCAAVLEMGYQLTAKRPESTVYLVGTVQEEYNLRGGMMAARSIKPDIAIGLDGGGGSDTPDLKGAGHVGMGLGPIMSLYNFHGRGTLNGTIPHPAMVRLTEESSKELGMPLQRSAHIGGLTELAYIQLEGKGVMSIDLGYPGRYTHSPCECADMEDIDKLCTLVNYLVHKINDKTDFSR